MNIPTDFNRLKKEVPVEEKINRDENIALTRIPDVPMAINLIYELLPEMRKVDIREHELVEVHKLINSGKIFDGRDVGNAEGFNRLKLIIKYKSYVDLLKNIRNLEIDQHVNILKRGLVGDLVEKGQFHKIKPIDKVNALKKLDEIQKVEEKQDVKVIFNINDDHDLKEIKKGLAEVFKNNPVLARTLLIAKKKNEEAVIDTTAEEVVDE